MPSDAVRPAGGVPNATDAVVVEPAASGVSVTLDCAWLAAITRLGAVAKPVTVTTSSSCAAVPRVSMSAMIANTATVPTLALMRHAHGSDACDDFTHTFDATCVPLGGGARSLSLAPSSRLCE